MSDEVRISTEELHKLGTKFEISADDLGRELTAFRRRADAGALCDGFGSREAAKPYLELYEQAERALEQLRERLAEVAGGIRETAVSTDTAEEELVKTIRGVR
ncbi:WXG100 family type VII secretion target [Streptomyces sp. NPDC018045]|uniref:WXG100 family type VII secretion target n=1 Tax=Streptomyces sp. NPDC018045 TaxID=3365037 RepID=UPI0037919C59